MIIRSTARPMPAAPKPSDEAIQAAREAAATEAQARRDAGAADRRNYATPATGTPKRSAYGDASEDISNAIEATRNATPRERAMTMRDKMRAVLAAGDNNDPAINGR